MNLYGKTKLIITNKCKKYNLFIFIAGSLFLLYRAYNDFFNFPDTLAKIAGIVTFISLIIGVVNYIVDYKDTNKTKLDT